MWKHVFPPFIRNDNFYKFHSSVSWICSGMTAVAFRRWRVVEHGDVVLICCILDYKPSQKMMIYLPLSSHLYSAETVETIHHVPAQWSARQPYKFMTSASQDTTQCKCEGVLSCFEQCLTSARISHIWDSCNIKTNNLGNIYFIYRWGPSETKRQG